MKTSNTNIKYLEDWYGFYKSINIENNNNRWLIELALDFYENKLSHLYHLKQNDDTDISIHVSPDMDILPSTYNSVDNPSSGSHK